MMDVNLIKSYMSKTQKIEINSKDYVSIIVMLIGASIALLFVYLMVSGIFGSGVGESDLFSPPWR